MARKNELKVLDDRMKEDLEMEVEIDKKIYKVKFIDVGFLDEKHEGKLIGLNYTYWGIYDGTDHDEIVLRSLSSKSRAGFPKNKIEDVLIEI